MVKSRQFPLRMDDKLFQEIEQCSAECGLSMNRVICGVLNDAMRGGDIMWMPERIRIVGSVDEK